MKYQKRSLFQNVAVRSSSRRIENFNRRHTLGIPRIEISDQRPGDGVNCDRPKWGVLKLAQGIAIFTLLLASVGWIAPAWAATMEFAGSTSISIDLPSGLDYYKIDQPDGYGNPVTNSAEVGEYLDYPGFGIKQIDDDSGVERDGTAMAQADGKTASNSFTYDPDDSAGVFSTTGTLEMSVSGFSAQYAENRIGLHFYVAPESVGSYEFNITIDNWQRVLTWAQISGSDLLEGGWYSGLNAYLLLDGEDAALAGSSIVLLSQVMDVFPAVSGSESYSGSTSLSLTQVLEEGWYTLYISEYTKQYNITPVPLPGTLPLMVSGLIALGLIKKRRPGSLR